MRDSLHTPRPHALKRNISATPFGVFITSPVDHPSTGFSDSFLVHALSPWLPEEGASWLLDKLFLYLGRERAREANLVEQRADER